MSESLPQPQSGQLLTARGFLAAVAILVCVALTHEMIRFTGEPVYVTVSAVVGTFFALGAIRKPWFFLAIVGVVWTVFPTVHDSSADAILGGTYSLGSILGALAGWIIRSCRQRARQNVILRQESLP